MDPTLVVAAILRSPDGRVLVCRRAEHVPLAGKWEFPGGKVHQGESIFDAVLRELKEELGLHPFLERELGRVPFVVGAKYYRLVGILGSCDTQPVQLTAHCEYKWLSVDDIEQLDLAPADRPLLQALKTI